MNQEKKRLFILWCLLLCLFFISLNTGCSNFFINRIKPDNTRELFSPLANLGFDENDIVYMILTDRFQDGDSTNNDQGNGEYKPGNLKFYQGGDWQGIINKMSYLSTLGVTAIWISPVSDDEDISKDGLEGGYHGYFTHDYYAPNPHFGSVSKLTELVTTAHSYGIDVIIDVVPNHTADYLEPFASQYNPPSFAPAAPFNNPDWYHHNGDITNYNDPNQVENHDLGGLDDLDQDHPAARAEIINVYKYWFSTTGANAARIDVAKGLKKSFLEDFEDSLALPTFGEAFDGSVDLVSDYQNYIWGMLDFPLFFTIRDTLAYDHSMTKLGDLFEQDYKYSDPKRLVTFIDNHDRDRFLTVADDDFRRLRLALTLIFTARGIPDVYYATEQAYYGDGHPKEWMGIANEHNREVLTDFDQSSYFYQYIQRLAQIRNDYSALRQGQQLEMWKDPKVYAFLRQYTSDNSEAITILTNSWNTEVRTIPLRIESSISPGTTLTNLLDTNDTITVQNGGITGKQIAVTLPPKTAKIYVPDSVQSYTPIARTVTTIRVHYDTGYGNSMYIRGDQYPLWWDTGRGAHNESQNLWTWQSERIPAGTTLDY